MNGMTEGELERPLLIMSTTARLSEYMRMDLTEGAALVYGWMLCG